MLLNNRLIHCLLCLLFSPFVFAANNYYEYTCPSTIKVKESIGQLQEPWKPMEKSTNNQDNYLRGFPFRLYSGHPSKGITLSPESDLTDRRNKTRFIVWLLSPNEQYWLACTYMHTRLLVTQQLPEKISVCQMVTPVSPVGYSTRDSQKIICR